ncbi:MFS transporter [Rhodopseudomonas boonkerdii]|uniref:MFS transporter n=1 Tax=Rhodopseudomonas boonkerdii TaxID=475937 RepID=UPI001E3A8A4B|nr:MFS transporter [Rhodopseudomonas boonkerdii]UGV25993.1 MFS transporter [Rhodopseudomonas boonkerdii]
MSAPHARRIVVTLGGLQILAWGSSFYLLGVLAPAIARDTGWSTAAVVGGISLALLTAGIVSPRVGHLIQAHGGRPVLAISSLLFAAGLGLLAAATQLPVYFAAWAIIGLGMASGLYDPAFATLGRQFGHSARQMITTVTLFGGFASTVCWPLTAWLLEHHGWRLTCATYAGLHLVIGGPAYALLLPKRPPAPAATAGAAHAAKAELPLAAQTTALILLGVILTIGAVTMSLLSAHLLILLQMRGIDLAAAVGLGALIGPSQVAARVVEMAFGRRLHPLWTMLAGVVLVASGIALLATGFPFMAVALIAYGAGNGISSIVRGAVPLVLFGPGRYAILMGRLGLPILIGMATAPTAGALLLDIGGPSLAFSVLALLSTANVLIAGYLTWFCLKAEGQADRAAA